MECTVKNLMSKPPKKKRFPDTENNIFVYPRNNVEEIVKIMQDINLQELPVRENPWSKKIIGVIEFNKLKFLL